MFWAGISGGTVVLLFILLPLMEMMTAPEPEMLAQTLRDREVVKAIWLSISTAGAAAGLSFLFGTPLAYLLSRTSFPGKRVVESIIDLPIVIPHPVIGIAILSVAGRNHWLGALMQEAGIHIMGSVGGIITVLTFVGLPLYVNAAKAGFEAVGPRLERVSRTLGAPPAATFFRITFPLARRSMLVGIVMCIARAVSEFGAVVIVAYHPMIAPVLIFERYEAFGLKYSQPVAFWLIAVSLSLFLLLRTLTVREEKQGKRRPGGGPAGSELAGSGLS